MMTGSKVWLSLPFIGLCLLGTLVNHVRLDIVSNNEKIADMETFKEVVIDAVKSYAFNDHVTVQSIIKDRVDTIIWDSCGPYDPDEVVCFPKWVVNRMRTRFNDHELIGDPTAWVTKMWEKYRRDTGISQADSNANMVIILLFAVVVILLTVHEYRVQVKPNRRRPKLSNGSVPNPTGVENATGEENA